LVLQPIEARDRARQEDAGWGKPKTGWKNYCSELVALVLAGDHAGASVLADEYHVYVITNQSL